MTSGTLGLSGLSPKITLHIFANGCCHLVTDKLLTAPIFTYGNHSFSSFDEMFTIHFTTLNSTIQTSLENVVPLGVFLIN